MRMSEEEVAAYMASRRTQKVNTVKDLPRNMINPLKNDLKSKYHNVKTEVFGELFDSKAEAKRYMELKSLERAGVIHSLTRQEGFILQEGFTDCEGHKIRPILYFSDFSYYDMNDKIVEDVKSVATARNPLYKLKTKILKCKFPEIHFREVIR